MNEYSFTINATFTADTQQDAWDEWVEWLTNPGNLEDGTEVVQFPPVHTHTWGASPQPDGWACTTCGQRMAGGSMSD